MTHSRSRSCQGHRGVCGPPLTLSALFKPSHGFCSRGCITSWDFEEKFAGMGAFLSGERLRHGWTLVAQLAPGGSTWTWLEGREVLLGLFGSLSPTFLGEVCEVMKDVKAIKVEFSVFLLLE